MKKQLGPVEIVCDAPPYPIVKACKVIGLQDPEDVRWNRLSNLMGGNNGDESSSGSLWKLLVPGRSSRQAQCVCGATLPGMEEYIFTFARHGDLHLLLGQCPKCRTIVWES